MSAINELRPIRGVLREEVLVKARADEQKPDERLTEPAEQA
jgi:hypothetical protein